MPAVSRISIAPVKGLGLLHPDSVALEDTGVRENRRFHIVDADGRRFNQMRNGTMVQIRPGYDADAERLALHFPDGTVAEGQLTLGEEVTTDFYGRAVVGNAVEGPWSEALSAWAGRPLRLIQSKPGLAVDRGRGHVSLISTASLEELGRQGDRQEPIDGRRFRMLFELEGCEPHEEDGWVKRHLRIGEATVRIRGDVGRCAITTQNPETGEPDFDTLRAISGYRPFTENEAGARHIPFGVYGEVTGPGRVTIGDSVELGLLDQTS
ncbi:MAG: MOSC domain-containing protein [Actinobacteria bacterium]|nr:MOSC domain-containing protein [Actinomycetota bacterium]